MENRKVKFDPHTNLLQLEEHMYPSFCRHVRLQRVRRLKQPEPCLLLLHSEHLDLPERRQFRFWKKRSGE